MDTARTWWLGRRNWWRFGRRFHTKKKETMETESMRYFSFNSIELNHNLVFSF